MCLCNGHSVSFPVSFPGDFRCFVLQVGCVLSTGWVRVVSSSIVLRIGFGTLGYGFNIVLHIENEGLDLTEEELAGVVIQDDDWEEGVAGSSLLLVGQVLGRRSIHWDNFTSLVTRLWSPTLGVEVKRLSKDNRFLFSFKHVKDKSRALLGGPWHYNRNLIVLGEVPTVGSPNLMELSICDFHVRVESSP